MTQPCDPMCPFLGCASCAYSGGAIPAAATESAPVSGVACGKIEASSQACETPATRQTSGGVTDWMRVDMPSIATAPTPTSVYLYFDALDVLIYVGVTSRGTQRQREHNGDKEWWQFVSRQEVRHFDTRAEALAEERRLIVKHLPPFNRSHNPSHVQARAAYFDLQAARAVSLSATERKSVRRGLILTAMSSPLAGHDITLFSSAVDASALPGELDTTRIQTVKVSTPGRLNSGRAVSARFVGGMLLIGVIGKYLPEDVVRARAQITVIPNRKPAGFELKRILLNENDHMAGILGSRTT